MARHLGPWPPCPRCGRTGRELRRRWALVNGEPIIVTEPDPATPCGVCRGWGRDPFA